MTLSLPALSPHSPQLSSSVGSYSLGASLHSSSPSADGPTRTGPPPSKPPWECSRPSLAWHGMALAWHWHGTGVASRHLLPPQPWRGSPCGRDAKPSPSCLCIPPGSLVSWPRSREAPGRMCVTSLQSLTQISLQAPLSPSSPKFYWARENEGRPQAPSPHRHCAPLSTPQPSLPLAWTQETRDPAPPLGTGSGHRPGTLLSFPAPSLLSKVDGPMR